MRYFRQGYEFSLEVDPGSLMNGGLHDLEMRFGTAHERLYGFKLEQAVELVNLRAVGTGRVDKVEFPEFPLEDRDPSAAILEQHGVYFGGNAEQTVIYDRSKLRAGNRITGPAVVTQKDSTTIIHPGHTGEVDQYLNILLRPDNDQLH